MTFNQLYNLATSSKSYNIDTSIYKEKYPEFESVANYLENNIKSYPTSACINDLIKSAKSSLLPRMMHNREHINILAHINGKSDRFFGTLIYRYLCENYKQVRKYLHIIKDRNDPRLMPNSGQSYAKIDDASFSGVQFRGDLIPGKTYALFSLVKSRFHEKAAYASNTLTLCGPKAPARHYMTDRHVSNIMFIDKYFTDDGIGDSIIPMDDFYYDNTGIKKYYNVVRHNDAVDREKHTEMLKQCKMRRLDHMIYSSNVEARYSYIYNYIKVDERKYNVAFELNNVKYMAIGPDDTYTSMYVEHKYPDELSITPLPYRLPCVIDNLIDTDDMSAEELYDNGFKVYENDTYNGGLPTESIINNLSVSNRKVKGIKPFYQVNKYEIISCK